MKQSLLTADMIAEFEAKGGKSKRIGFGETAGVSQKEWERLVRGEELPTVEAIAAAPRNLHLRAGYGAR